MLSYPVRIARTPDGMMRAIFLDVPEAVAEGDTEEDAIYRAKFTLELSLGNYVLHGRPLPVPSDVPGAPVVTTEKFSIGAGRRDAEPVAAAPGGGRY